MGALFSSSLPDEDLHEIREETGFSEYQIRRLYSRFVHLDKQSKGFLTRQDLMLIPELAVNPLGSCIIDAFLIADSTTSTEPSKVTCNFRQFVRTLARFRKLSSHDEHELSSIDRKIEFVFKVYDSDNDGKISKTDLKTILQKMVGLNITEEQLGSIVKRTMKEADKNKDELIDIEEFKRALGDIDVEDKMSVRFLET